MRWPTTSALLDGAGETMTPAAAAAAAAAKVTMDLCFKPFGHNSKDSKLAMMLMMIHFNHNLKSFIWYSSKA
jgi:hypothetical protein